MSNNVEKVPICRFCGLSPIGCGQCSWTGNPSDTQTKMVEPDKKSKD